MRILCLTSRLPYPPHRGDRLRVFNFIKELSREHQLSLISFVAGPSEFEHLDPLRPYCRDVQVLQMDARRSALAVLANLWRREPLQALYYRARGMQGLVDRTLTRERFDAIYVHLFRMAPYVIGRSDVYRIVDLTDVISQEVSRSLPYRRAVWRLLYWFERPRIERYERTVAEAFEETWLISEADRRILSAVCPEANIHVVTNGVDVERFYPSGRSAEDNHLVFVGHLRVFHNVDAVTHLVRDVLPLVRQRVPEVTLDVVGADPGPQVQQLAKAQGVSVLGFVPDLNKVLNRAAVFVAPLRFAAGVQNKVLEAMAAGRPVVTTSIVNKGLGAQPGQEVLIADDAMTMADRIADLLGDESLRRQIGQAGLRFVRQTYSWQKVSERMRKIEESVVRDPSRQPGA